MNNGNKNKAGVIGVMSNSPKALKYLILVSMFRLERDRIAHQLANSQAENMQLKGISFSYFVVFLLCFMLICLINSKESSLDYEKKKNWRWLNLK